ncbi:MAG: serine/threonine protein kinase [Gammaproteobacteria bacterium]|nr:serine/threonine protein kinase [Gammaproteobacteria bacterium]MDH4315966.1 serine/threonine protein kinase [Gammaproteobacteria bacterium]MDH5215386.1 serine/threonine protein kinase [Gammaproteobacteria bacterium]
MLGLELDREEFATLNRLLDEALDRPVAERAAWLEALPVEWQRLKPHLQDLLSRTAAVETADFLRTLPRFAAPAIEFTSNTAGAPRAGDIVGKYRLMSPLGSGGMGSVWLAERTDGLMRRRVALKLPHGTWAPAGLAERMARERQILATLEHSRIARLYDAGLSDDGRPYLAIEFIEGQSIDAFCEATAPDIRSRIRLFLQVADAVAYAHGKLVLHRDLKPANILVTPQGEVCLLDFGIAKLLDDGLTHETRLTEFAGRALTLDYASPEQVRGESLTVASDLYSLGVVLYELLANSRPYRLRHESRRSLEEAILQADPIRPSEVAPLPVRKALRGDLDTIVLKMLKKNPNERYTTVQALAEDLERYLVGLPVRARPDTAAYRISRFVHRHRFATTASAVFVLSLLLAAGIATRQARIAIDEKNRAEEIKNFIASIFRDADPWAGVGKQLAATDLLLQAGNRIERDFADRPELQVELLNLVAASLANLQDYENADLIIAQAFSTATSSLGTGHALTRESAITSMVVDRFRGQTDAMKGRLEPLLAEARNDPETPPRTLVSLLNLATHLAIDEQRRVDAENLAVEALQVARRDLGENDLMTLDVRQALLTAFLHNDKAKEVLPEAERLVAGVEAAHPGQTTHPRVLDARYLYARALADSGFPSAAIQQFALVLSGAQEVFGTNSSFEAYVRHHDARARYENGDIRGALASMERSREIFAPLLDQRSTASGISEAAYGQFLLSSGQYEQSAVHLKAAVATLGELVGKDALSTRTNEALLAISFAKMARFAEARMALKRAAGIDGTLTSNAIVNLYHVQGIVERLAGNAAQSVQLQRASLEALEDGPKTRWARARILGELGLALFHAGEAEKAEQSLALSLAEFADLQSQVTPQTAELHQAFGELAFRRGDLSIALDHFSAGHEFWGEFAPESDQAKVAERWVDACRSKMSEADRTRHEADGSLRT